MAKDISADQVEGGANAGDQVDGGTHEPIQLAAASIPQAPVVVTQAGGFNAPPATPPQGPFVPVVPPGAVSATAGSTTAYAIGIDSTVRLPPGTVIAMAEVVGNDLHLMQPDGSLIVIVNGGVSIPLLLVGNIAFGGDTVAALLGLSQVQPAAPAAAAAAGGVGSAGGEFALPGGPIDPNAINLTALLPPTALQFGVPEIEEIGFAFDDDPTVDENPGVIADDDDLSGGNAGGVGDDDATDLSGVLAHDFGDDGPGAINFLTTGAPEGFTYELSGNDLLILQNGTLVLAVTLDPLTGAYTVIQNAPIDHLAGDNENNQAFTLTYRVTDSNGDFVDGTLNIDVDDDTPTVTANTNAMVDDDNLAGGNPGGAGDDEPASVSGTLSHSFGADGGSIAFLITDAPDGFTYELSGSSLLVKQGSTLVLTITLNTVTGAYTITQNAPIEHLAGDNENNQAFTIGYRVTDGDGDIIDGTLNISVDDDTPTASSNAGVVVDEDDLPAGNHDNAPGDDAPANVTGTLDHSFGADGPGAVAVLGSGAPTGFTYTLSGGGTILTISQDSSGLDVVRVTVNLTTGAYEVELLNPIDHSAGGSENNVAFSINYSVTDGDGDSLNGSLSISVDDDIPTVNEQARPIAVTVLEDGLALSEGDLSDGNREGGETTAADETSGAAGSLTALFSVGADEPLEITLSTNISGLPTLFSKGDAITYSVSGNVLTATADAGGPDQRVVFTLTINPNGSWSFDLKDQLDHVDNGPNDENYELRTAADGSTSVGEIDFSSIILGTDADGDSVAAVPGTFTVDVQDDVPAGDLSGTVTIHVDEDNLSAAAGDGDLSTGVVDVDTDTDEAIISGAAISAVIADGADEPVELAFDGEVSGNVKTTGGADVKSQGDTVKWAVVDALHVVGFADTNNDGIWNNGEREVFRLTDNGDGTFTFDLKDQLDHAPASGDETSLTLDLTEAFSVTDLDGDEIVLGAGTIRVEVENDVPVAAGSATASIRVDEDELSTASGDGSTGITDNDGDTDQATFSSSSLAALVTPGADEPVDISLNNAVSGNVVTTNGTAVLSKGGNVVWGTNDGALVGFVNLGGGAGFDAGVDREVFRVTDNGDGTFTFALKDQVDHSPASGDNGILTLDLTGAFTATDYDGDPVTLNADSITVVVENDVPTGMVSGTVSIRVDEDELSTASGDSSTGITDDDGDTDEATFTSASFAAVVTPGADEDAEFALNLGASGNVVTTTGNPVLSQGANVIWGTNAGVLVGFVNLGGGAGFDLGVDREVFRVTGDGNGSFTFALKDQIDHNPAAGDNGILTLDLSIAFGVTDFDGDAVTLPSGSVTVVVENDIPAAAGSATASIRVDEDELSSASGDGSTGITDGDGDTDETTFSSASLAALVTPGADEPVDINLNGAVSGNVMTTNGTAVLSKGANVVWGTDNGALVGFVNLGGGAGFDAGTDREVFRVTDNGNGTFTFQLKDQIDHNAAAGDNGILTLDLTSAFTATDYDGDAIALNPNSITVVVENDIPAAAGSATASIRVDEDELSTATGDLSNGITDGDADMGEATFSSASLVALVTPGADEPVDINLNGTVSGNVVTTNGDAILSKGANVVWGADGGALVGFVNLGGGAGFDPGTDREVFRVTDNGNGTFTFDLKDQLDHTPVAGDNGILTLDLTGAFTATDYDGDAVTLNADSITVVVENDVPAGVVSGTVSIRVDEDELSTASGDNSTGITDGDADTDEATFTSASFAAAVTPGADEDAKFALNLGASGNVVMTNGTAVLSQGANVVWGTTAGALVGFVNLGGGGGFDLGIDREVFRVTDDGSGSFTFDLKDQIDHAPAAGDNGILTLDLSIAFGVTDFDGDAVTLPSGSVTVVVENDIPAVAGTATASIRVDEDELSTATGDLSTGITDGDGDTDEATFSSASLAALVTPGADEPVDFNLNGAISGNVVTTNGTAVLSKGANVVWGTDSGALVGFVNLGGGAGFDLGVDREVFRVTDKGNGTFTFDLKDQLDHTPAAGDNGILTLDLTGAFTATDYDGDPVTLNPDSITVVVENDIPAAAGTATASIRVDEDELSTATGDLSTGIADGDGDTDEATFSSAALAALVTPGADEPVDINLNGALTGNVVTTNGTAVLSKGANVLWGTDGGALVGFVNLGGGAGFDLGVDREVFRLTDNGNGTFTFDLKDQIDHSLAAGDNDILTLDLTGAFSATDYDGDAVTLNADSITVVVENDIPVAAGSATASIRVDEDELSTATGDLSTGITDGDADTDEATFSSASLAALVTPGADELVDINLNGAVSGNVVTTNGTAVLSKGANVVWGTDGGALVGFVNLGGGAGFDLGVDREVFRLTDNGNGTFTFDLKDQLDHGPAAGDSGILTLDLTGAFTAVDYDGDPVTLNADSITVVVENDIPAAAGSATASIRVDEDELSTATSDLSTGITDGDGDTDEATFSSASLAALVTPGADEPIDFNLDGTVSGNVVTTNGTAVLSKGANVVWGTDGGALVGFVNLGGGAGFDLGVDREVFRVIDNGNGSFTFDLKDQIDHTPAAGDNGVLTLDLTGAFTATDYDGDPVTLSADSITVAVENDVPALGSGSVSRTVHEDAINNPQGDGNEEGVGQTTIATGTLSGLAIVGADENGGFGINPDKSGLPALTSKGGTVVYDVNGNTLTAYVEVSGAGYQAGVDRAVFTLTINAAGEFTFTLIDQIDHLPNVPANDDAQTLVLNLSSAIRFTDFDGDSVVLASGLSITIQDDIPKLGSIEDGSISNNTTASFTGDMPVDIGADEPAKASLLSNVAPADLTSGGLAVHYHVNPADPDTLIAYTGANPADSSSWVFTLTVDASTDEYTFHIIKPLDGELVTVTVGDSSAFGAGPGAAYVLDDGAAIPTELSIVSGWAVTGFNFANWIATGSPGAVSAAEVNGSTGGWGVNANSFNGTDLLRFDFGDADDFDGGGIFDPPIFNGPATSVANFGFNSFGGGAHSVYVVVHYTDGSVLPYNGAGGNGLFAFNGGTANLAVTAPAGKYIDYVEFYANGEAGGGKITLDSTSVINEVVDIDLQFNVDITDHDGDTASGTIDINVTPPDDFPDAILDEDTVPEGGQVVNAAFVLDFSGSIDNNELDQQLDAVRAAGQQIFAAGTAIISIIIFSSTAVNAGTFTDFASFQAAVNGMNPLESGGVRPSGIGVETDFTAAIQKTMSEWVPSGTTNNQVFFISDGNPTEQLGTGGNSLSDATATAWANFIATHDVNVTTIGVGDNIQVARLQNVDLDGSGTPILVADFGALLDTLLTVVGGDTQGNVLENDTPGNGGFQIVSITVDGVTFTYNGVNITPSNGDPVIAGKVLSIDTALGGHLTFHFATGGGFGIGDYKYDAPSNLPGDNPVDETFTYVIRDADGDLDNANLVITITPNTPPDAVSDVIQTNHLAETFAIPFSAIMVNDSHSGGTIIGVTGGAGGTVALDMVNQAVLFTPTALALPNGSFSYILQNSDGSIDAATVNITGANTQQVNATAPGQILIGNDYALYFSISGDDQSFSGQTDADEEEIYKWNGSAFSEYYGGGELDPASAGNDEDALGEDDIDALHITPSGGILFSIVGDDEEFNGIGSNLADNEDIFALSGASDTSYEEVTYVPGDGSSTWSENNLNALFQFSNGNLVMSFSVPTDPLPIGGVTYQPYELVLYNVSANIFSEFADGMLSSGVIDAVDVLANGNVIFSMAADTTLGGTLYEDSDLIRWNGAAYSKYFDGSDNGLATAEENIDGVSILGSDILVGGSGNDILMGLGGEDLLTGGAGADTFRLTEALAADTITDYNHAAGDTIDLSALLDQALVDAGDLDDFVKLTNQGPDRVLQIDANGTAGGSSYTTVAIFTPAAPATVHILYDNAQADVPQT